MRISRSHFTYFLIAIALALVLVLCMVAGCQASVRIDPGTAEVSHTHRVITVSQQPTAPPPALIHVRVINPGDTHRETSHPGSTASHSLDPVAGTLPAADHPR